MYLVKEFLVLLYCMGWLLLVVQNTRMVTVLGFVIVAIGYTKKLLVMRRLRKIQLTKGTLLREYDVFVDKYYPVITYTKKYRDYEWIQVRGNFYEGVYSEASPYTYTRECRVQSTPPDFEGDNEFRRFAASYIARWYFVSSTLWLILVAGCYSVTVTL